MGNFSVAPVAGKLRLLILFLFVAAAAIRLCHITEPPDDFHPFRQYRCASIARAFYEEAQGRADWAHESADNRHFQDGVLEPPVVEFISVGGYFLLGGEKLWFARVLSVGYWLIAAGLLWRLARRLAGDGPALVTLAVMLFLPYGIVGSRAFQPEPLMVMLQLLTITAVFNHFAAPLRKRFWLAAALAAVTFLIKPTGLFAVFAVFGGLSLWHRGLKATLFGRESILFTVVSMLPAVSYYGWGIWHVAKLQDQATMSFVPQLYTHLHYWTSWARMIGRTAGLLPFAAGLGGILFFARGPARVLVASMFGGYFAYGLVFNYHIHTHDYYSLQLIPIVALALGPITLAAGNWLGAQWRISAWRLAVTLALGGVLLAGGLFAAWQMNLKRTDKAVKERLKAGLGLVGLSEKVFRFVRPGYYGYEQMRADAVEIGELVHHSHHTVLLCVDGPMCVSYFGRLSGKDWPESNLFRFERDVRRLPPIPVAQRFARGFQPMDPEYFIITELGDFAAQPELKEFLDANYPVLADRPGHYRIYRLKPAVPPANP